MAWTPAHSTRATASPPRSRRLIALARRGVGGAIALGAACLALVGAVPSAASAAPSTSLLYSVDGGASWSATVVAAPGQEVLVRQWFANTGDDAVDGAVASTAVPDRFDLVGGSTSVCLNPSTTDPLAPDGGELACVAADEGSVWTGGQLAISPSAGHFGSWAGASAGPLAAGRSRFLNLHQCSYESVLSARTDTWTMITPSESDPGAASNVALVADTAPSCGTRPTFTLLPDRSGVTAFDLFDRRYLGLQQCRWVDGGSAGNQRAMVSYIPGTVDPRWRTRSATTDLPGIGDACNTLPPAGWSLAPTTSGVQMFDLLEDRYVNIFTCLWQSDIEATHSTSIATITDATAASLATGSSDQATGDDPSSGDCPPRAGMVAGSGQVHASKAFDLLDRSRSAGYVTYRLAAPETRTAEDCASGSAGDLEPFDQQAVLAAPSLTDEVADGRIVVDWTQSTGADPCGGGGIPVADPAVAVAITALAGGIVFMDRLARRDGRRAEVRVD